MFYANEANEFEQSALQTDDEEENNQRVHPEYSPSLTDKN